MTGRTLQWTLAAALLPLLLAGGSSTPAGDRDGSEGGPLPFDPLSPGEQERAIAIALDDPILRDRLSDRFEVVGTALHTDKAYRSLGVWPRVAEVWFYDHGSGLAVRALVDLGAGSVGLVETLAVQPPLTGGEVDRAGRAALGDPSVRERLEAAGIQAADVRWTARLWTGSGPTSCPEHRCALVGFLDGGTFVPGILVVADLTDGAVRLATPPAAESVQDAGDVP